MVTDRNFFISHDCCHGDNVSIAIKIDSEVLDLT